MNTPIVETNPDYGTAPARPLDPATLRRPAPTPQIAVTAAYDAATSTPVEQLPQFIQSNWNITEDQLSNPVRIVLRFMREYVEKMGPNSVLTPPDKARQQHNLYKAIIMALSAPADQSLIAMRIIMFLIHGYKKTIFSDRHALEASDLINFTRDENKAFRSLVTLLINTSDPATRKHVLKRQVDLNKVVSTLQTQALQDALIRFYSINMN